MHVFVCSSEVFVEKRASFTPRQIILLSSNVVLGIWHGVPFVHERCVLVSCCAVFCVVIGENGRSVGEICNMNERILELARTSMAHTGTRARTTLVDSNSRTSAEVVDALR